jgi:plastocyanin
MLTRISALAVAMAATALAACAGHYGAGNGSSSTLPGMPDLRVTATLPNGTPIAISENLPSDLGTIDDPHWSATVGGYTQQQYSQVLGFPPGTMLTITNVSGSIPHTFNVIGEIKAPPANFPANPTLLTTPKGTVLKKGYRSGVIMPGKSVSVKMAKKGTYLIGCAFHYKSAGMRDVVVVAAGATPGPEATPPGR